MLYRSEELRDYHIRAVDGDIGEVAEFYFEDTNWSVRYIVVDTGVWLFSRQVLISPYAAGEPDPKRKALPVNLTREQVEKSPESDRDRPISRQHEHSLHAHYGWPIYWGNPGVIPGFIPVPPLDLEPPPEEMYYNQHLRSSKEIEGYRIHATDGEVGHVSDIIIDIPAWSVLYLVVKTGARFSGRKVLFAADRVEEIDFVERKVWIDVSREQMQNSPEYDSAVPISREYEERLYDHYGWPKYWDMALR